MVRNRVIALNVIKLNRCKDNENLCTNMMQLASSIAKLLFEGSSSIPSKRGVSGAEFIH